MSAEADPSFVTYSESGHEIFLLEGKGKDDLLLIVNRVSEDPTERKRNSAAVSLTAEQLEKIRRFTPFKMFQ